MFITPNVVYGAAVKSCLRLGFWTCVCWHRLLPSRQLRPMARPTLTPPRSPERPPCVLPNQYCVTGMANTCFFVYANVTQHLWSRTETLIHDVRRRPLRASLRAGASNGPRNRPKRSSLPHSSAGGGQVGGQGFPVLFQLLLARELPRALSGEVSACARADIPRGPVPRTTPAASHHPVPRCGEGTSSAWGASAATWRRPGSPT